MVSQHKQGSPGDPEHDLALWLTELLQNGDELWALLEHGLQGGDHLIHSLQELLLVGVPGLDLVEDCLYPRVLIRVLSHSGRRLKYADFGLPHRSLNAQTLRFLR